MTTPVAVADAFRIAVSHRLIAAVPTPVESVDDATTWDDNAGRALAIAAADHGPLLSRLGITNLPAPGPTPPPPPRREVPTSRQLAAGQPTIRCELDPDSDGILLAGVMPTALQTQLRLHAPAARWDPTEGAWRVPRYDVPAAGRIAAEQGWPVDTNAQRLIDTTTAASDALFDLSYALEPTEVFDIPGLAETWNPRPAQLAAIEYMARVRRSMNADPPGLGKTFMASATIAVTDTYPALVVTKARLRINWQKDLAKTFPGVDTVILDGREQTGQAGTAAVTIVNYDVLQHRLDELMAVKWGALVFDESHYLKEPPIPDWYVKARNEGKTRKRKPEGSWRTWAATQIAQPVAERDGVICELTGTPRPNRTRELFPQIAILGHDTRFGGPDLFYVNHCDKQMKYGRVDIDGSSNLDELRNMARRTFMCARRKTDAYPQLPPLLTLPVFIEMSKTTAKEYAKAEADIIRFVGDKAADTAREEGATDTQAAKAAGRAQARVRLAKEIVEKTTLRRLVGAAKVDGIGDWIEEYIAEHPTGEDGRPTKFVVFAHHRDTQLELAARLGGVTLEAAAYQKEVDAEAAKEQFQNDPDCRIIVCSMAAKEGHTLTAAEHVLVAELPWTWDDLEQCAGRAYGRIADLHGANLWLPVALGTIDEAVWEMVENKSMESEQTLHGSGSGPVMPPLTVDNVLDRMLDRLLSE